MKLSKAEKKILIDALECLAKDFLKDVLHNSPAEIKEKQIDKAAVCWRLIEKLQGGQ